MARTATLLTVLLLSGVSGCQWCPRPDGAGTGATSQPPAAQTSSPPAATEQAGTRIERARRLRDAERGQQAMVRCLQSERALTEGNELRCEDWSVVREEFLER